MPRIKLVLVNRAACTIVSWLALAAVSLQARESVCLRSGFCLEAESLVVSDGMLTLQNGAGTLQFPVDQVARIEDVPSSRSASPSHASGVSSNVVEASEELLVRAAIQQGLEPDFVRSVAMIESGMRQESMSSKGAIGLMQLMPDTAGTLGVDAAVAEQNAQGGATFLRQLLLKYNGDSMLALAAYNAGPGAVAKYQGVPPYLETRRYVVKVLQEYARRHRLQTEKNLQAFQTDRSVQGATPVIGASAPALRLP
jgi:hypothetical protein